MFISILSATLLIACIALVCYLLARKLTLRNAQVAAVTLIDARETLMMRVPNLL
jgi:type IV secretory pathway VirB3-like protein